MTEEVSRFAHLRAAALSDIGRKRKNNEDSFGAFPSHGVWCVADGMGGGDDGEVASAAVVKSVDAYLSDLPVVVSGGYAGEVIAKGVIAAVEEASNWIFRRTKKKKLKGCGSTFVGIVFDATKPGTAMALHVGDSRLYRLRGKELKQITKDHSVAEMMGAKDEKDLNPMFRGMILRAVGIEGPVQVDETPLAVNEGDTILICSDGLSRMVPDKRIGEIIREGGDDVEGAARRLIAAANEAGGIDNITVELIRVGALPTALPAVSITRNEDSSVSSSTCQTLERAYGGPQRGLLRRLLTWQFSVGVVVACVMVGLGWIVFRSLNREKPRAVVAPAVEAMPAVEIRQEETNVPARTPSSLPRQEKTAAVPVIDVPATNASAAATAPAKDAVAVSEDSERNAVEEELKAERARRQRADAAAAGLELERRQVAQKLAKTQERDFVEFAGFINSVFGKGTCDKAQALGRQLSVRSADANASLYATDFTAEIAQLAVRLGEKCSKKGLRRDSSAAALLERCKAVSDRDPALPETQRKCLELIEFVAAKRMQKNGRK